MRIKTVMNHNQNDGLPEVGSRRVVVGYGATKILNAFVYLPQLEISYAPVAVGYPISTKTLKVCYRTNNQ